MLLALGHLQASLDGSRLRAALAFAHFASRLGIADASIALLSPLAKFFILHSSFFI